MEMEMRSFFSGDFCRQLSPLEDQLPQSTDPNRPSSSSSSLRSLSTSSPDSSLIFTVPTTHEPSSFNDPRQAMQAFSRMRCNVRLPTLEGDNKAMTKAILAVLTSPSSSSASSSSTPLQRNQNLPYNYQLNPNASAFKRYASTFGGPTTTPARSSLRAQAMMKRVILFYRKFNLARREQLIGSRQTSNQLHHMMSERKRREKLNESFTALRSLLPPGTKRDKASVLISAREYLASLKEQIMELSRQNQLLEAQLLPSKEAAMEVNSSSSERVNVVVMPVSESTSQQRLIDLRVNVRGEGSIADILIHLLEFLKLDRNVKLKSVEANTRLSEFGSVNLVNLRLRIEGNGWDESTFKEAVRRLITDLAQ
ncbi:Alpha/beta-Hydrolases superfamily protein [Hibiscus syriacus]|uniref:Alpha/beta-Hydrolases superfamily protein n=2 Tax=Hibiscus syriacus TaxID=106335 RepID=A0A6A2Z7M4_HIBSY|nr:Alpha/beta-Hydrolases superfamily protein [Hibiscus syriacus]